MSVSSSGMPCAGKGVRGLPMYSCLTTGDAAPVATPLPLVLACRGEDAARWRGVRPPAPLVKGDAAPSALLAGAEAEAAAFGRMYFARSTEFANGRGYVLGSTSLQESVCPSASIELGWEDPHFSPCRSI